MTKIMDTTLLGKDLPEVGIPHQNIDGSLYIENGGLAFWSENEQVLFVPLDNINNYDASWTYKKGMGDLIGALTSLMTMSIVDTSKVYYVWLIYYSEEYGRYLKAHFQISRTFSNDHRANELIDSIASAIRDEREAMRRATRPHSQRKNNE